MKNEAERSSWQQLFFFVFIYSAVRCFVVRTFLAILFASFHFVPLRLRIKTTAMRRRRGPNVRDVRLHRESSLYDNKEEKERGRGSFLEVRDGLPISRAMKTLLVAPLCFCGLTMAAMAATAAAAGRERRFIPFRAATSSSSFSLHHHDQDDDRCLRWLFYFVVFFSLCLSPRRATHRTQFADNRMNEWMNE